MRRTSLLKLQKPQPSDISPLKPLTDGGETAFSPPCRQLRTHRDKSVVTITGRGTGKFRVENFSLFKDFLLNSLITPLEPPPLPPDFPPCQTPKLPLHFDILSVRWRLAHRRSRLFCVDLWHLGQAQQMPLGLPPFDVRCHTHPPPWGFFNASNPQLGDSKRGAFPSVRAWCECSRRRPQTPLRCPSTPGESLPFHYSAQVCYNKIGVVFLAFLPPVSSQFLFLTGGFLISTLLFPILPSA